MSIIDQWAEDDLQNPPRSPPAVSSTRLYGTDITRSCALFSSRTILELQYNPTTGRLSTCIIDEPVSTAHRQNTMKNREPTAAPQHSTAGESSTMKQAALIEIETVRLVVAAVVATDVWLVRSC